MILLFLVVSLPPAQPEALMPAQLLEKAQSLDNQIDQARRHGGDTRSLCRGLLDVCIALRRSGPASAALCINEGHAASLAGDWPHALLAYRLAQRLGPTDNVVASRLRAVRARLVLSDEPVSESERLAAVLATNTRLRSAFWLLGLLIYGAAWIRLASLAPRRTDSGAALAVLGIVGATAIVVTIHWADESRARNVSQPLVVIRKGEPVILREGNGRSYPQATAERLRAGTEATLLTRRGAWLRVRTNSGLMGWVPGAAAEVE